MHFIMGSNGEGLGEGGTLRISREWMTLYDSAADLVRIYTYTRQKRGLSKGEGVNE